MMILWLKVALLSQQAGNEHDKGMCLYVDGLLAIAQKQSADTMLYWTLFESGILL